MLKLFHLNSKPCKRKGLLRLRVDNFGDVIFNVVVKVCANEANFFRGSLNEKSVFIVDVFDKPSFVDIPYDTNFPDGIAKFSVKISYSKDPFAEERVMRYGYFSIEIKDDSNQINNTTYHIENKIHSEGNGISYFGGDNTSAFDKGKSSEGERAIPIELGKEKSCYAPPYFCKIESAKTLLAGKVNFIKILFSSSKMPNFCRHNYNLVRLAGSINTGFDVERFELEKFAIENNMFSARIAIKVPEAVTQISLENLFFEVEQEKKHLYLSAFKDSECCFDVVEDGEVLYANDFFDLQLQREFAPQPKTSASEGKNLPKNETRDVSINGEVSNVSPRDESAFKVPQAESLKQTKQEINISQNFTQQVSPQAIPPQIIVQPQMQIPQIVIQTQAPQVAPQTVANPTGGTQNSTPKAESENKGLSRKALEDIVTKANMMFGDGDSVRDAKAAFELYSEASKIGFPFADYRLGECFLRGIGVLPNAEKAYKYFKLAADEGVPLAIFRCYECNFWGVGTIQNKKLAMRFLHEASSLGIAKAKGLLAREYLLGDSITQNIGTALDLAKDGAKNGDINSVYILAHLFYFGNEEISRDLEKAAMYAEIASEAGHLGGSFIYAECLRNAEGIPANIDKGRSILKNLSESKDTAIKALACDSLATILANEGKKEEALEIFAEAISLGYTESIFKFAKMLQNGDGVPPSPNTAYAMMFCLAQSGHKESILEISECLLRGKGITKNAEEAYKFANSLMPTENPHCLYLIGMMKITGIGTRVDSELGKSYLKKSAEMGFSSAIKCLQRLESGNQ